MRTTRDGRGYMNILAADKLISSPQLYATFLLWLLSELFETMPEVGDPEKPKLVFFFDEAHLLFSDAPPGLLQKIEQTVKLIRSKGVGVYFVTQNPLDIPESVLAQMGNRIQHALRAYTPREQKAVRTAAETFRPNPKFDTQTAITELGKGEALVSFLEGNGTRSIVERVFIRPPSARIGPITPDERKALMSKSPVKGKYDTAVDSESAFEMLQKRVKDTAIEGPDAPAPGEAAEPPPEGVLGHLGAIVGIIFGTSRKRGTRLTTGQIIARDVTRTVTNRVAGQIANQLGKSVGGQVGGTLTKAIVRGALGGMLRR
jgi:DNA helicase HerA-like ATPase